jgi:integrase/recombinase XerD
MPAKGQRKTWPFLVPEDPQGMPALMALWIEAMRTRSLSESHVDTCQMDVSAFIVFCQERGVVKAAHVTKPVIERYQRHLFYYRKATRDGSEGEPLGVRTQIEKLTAIRLFFRWLARNNHVLSNPASDIDLPKIPPRKPPEVLSIAEVEEILSQPDLQMPFGIRDRAILETLYSTGMRRKELSRLLVTDLQSAAGIVRIRHGKGKKERIVPIGSRALAWIHRYLADVRPQLSTTPDDGTLFLTFTGKAFWPDTLTQLARGYVKKAGIAKPGSCHLFRHTMATLMLDNGADTRFIQEMLGHANLQTTQIYTHVAIKKLKEIHTATHPGATLASYARTDDAEASEELLSSLAAEPSDDVAGDE